MVDRSPSEKIEDSSRGIGSLVITQVEPVITRTPMSRLPADEFIEMPPIGFMYDRVGIGRRLDHASPSRFKRHSQTLLVKITTDQGLIGWGRSACAGCTGGSRQGDYGSPGSDSHRPGCAQDRSALGQDVFQPTAQGLCHRFLH